MDDAAVDLEAACRSLGSPNSAARTQSEAFLDHFKSLTPAVSVPAALRTACSAAQPAVAFHAVTVLREVLLRHWRGISPQDREQTRAALFDVAAQRSQLSAAVRNQALQTIAVMVKRGWLEAEEAQRGEWLARPGRLLQEGSLGALVGARLLHFIVDEFSTRRASLLGVPQQYHDQACGSFEHEGALLHVFTLGVDLLANAVRAFTDKAPGAAPDAFERDLLQAALDLILHTLGWEFGAYRRVGRPQRADAGPARRTGAAARTLVQPGSNWREALTRVDLASLLFALHSRVRTLRDCALAHSARQVLVLLASVHGDVFASEQHRVAHTHALLDGALALLEHPILGRADHRAAAAATGADAKDAEFAVAAAASECAAAADIVSRLTLAQPYPTWAALPAAPAVLDRMRCVTLASLHRAADAAGVPGTAPFDPEEEQRAAMEAVDLFMDAWHTLATDARNGGASVGPQSQDALREVLARCVGDVYQQYVRARLAIAVANVRAGRDDDEENDDEGSGEEAMQVAAALARTHPAAQLSFLASLLEEATGRLRQARAAPEAGPGQPMSPAMIDAVEELCWLVAMAGHLLADPAAGESPMVPMAFCATRSGHVGPDAMDLPGHSAVGGMLAPGEDEQVVQSIVRATSAVLALLGEEVAGMAAEPQGSCSSPALADALAWFFDRWAATYLMPDPRDYRVIATVSPRLVAAYGHPNDVEAAAPAGEGPPRGMQVLDYLVQHLSQLLALWAPDPEVRPKTLHALSRLVSRSRTAPLLTQLPAWWDVERAQSLESAGAQGPLAGLQRLPAEARGALLEILLRGGLASPDPALSERFMEQATRPVERALKAIIEGAKWHQRPGVDGQMVLVVELYRGIARATPLSNYRPTLRFILPALPALVHVLDCMHMRPEVVNHVLHFFSEFVEAEISCASKAEAQPIYEACGCLFKTYRDHNLGAVMRARQLTADAAEEERYRDLAALLQLLANLLSKDCLDFSDEGMFGGLDGGSDGGGQGAKAADVILFGLRMILPLVSREMLAFPKLSHLYFTVLGFVVEVYTPDLVTMDAAVFNGVVSSLVHGIRGVDAVVTRRALLAVYTLVAHHVTAMASLAMQAGGRQATGAPNIPVATEAALRDPTLSAGLLPQLRARPTLLVDLLSALLEQVVNESSIYRMLDDAANAIFVLILCEQNRFRDMVAALLRKQEDPSLRAQLEHEFQQLMTSNQLQMENTRAQRAAFRRNMQRFVERTRGLVTMR